MVFWNRSCPIQCGYRIQVTNIISLVTAHVCSICSNAADTSSLFKCSQCNTWCHQRCRMDIVSSLPDIGSPYTWRCKTNYLCLGCTYSCDDDTHFCENALGRVRRHINERGVDSDFARKVFTKENNDLLMLVNKLDIPKPFESTTGLVGDEDFLARGIITDHCEALLESYSPRATAYDGNNFYRLVLTS